jgi:hypothetical protein
MDTRVGEGAEERQVLVLFGVPLDPNGESVGPRLNGFDHAILRTGGHFEPITHAVDRLMVMGRYVGNVSIHILDGAPRRKCDRVAIEHPALDAMALREAAREEVGNQSSP